jgi:hypothetical protein
MFLPQVLVAVHLLRRQKKGDSVMPTIPVESWNDRTRFACFAGLRKWALFGERLEGYLDGLFEEFAGGTRKVEGMWGESASLGRIIDHLGSDINNIVDNLN